MKLMPVRYQNLQITYDVLQETGIYLLSKAQGIYCSLAQMAADDYGIYIIIPWLMSFFQLPLQQAIDCFFYGVLGLSFVTALLFFTLLGSTWISGWAFLSFLLLYREGFFRLTDVYGCVIAYNFLVMPFFLWFISKKRSIKVWSVTLFFIGIISGYAHYIRLYSSLAGLFFVIGYLLYQVRKPFMLLFLFLGISLPIAHIHFLIKKSDKFLQNNGIINTVPHGHSFWHNIYAGCGYIENYLDITYDDGSSTAFVKKNYPDIQYHSALYESIVRSECIRIFLKERLLIGTIFFAKLGVMIFYILACANIGLWFAHRYKKGFLEYLFWCGAALQMLPGLMVVPRVSYLSGLTSWMFIYGIYSIIYAFYIKK